MPIIFKGAVNNIPKAPEPVKQVPEPISFAEVKKQVVNQELKKTTTPSKQDARSDLIKPKYIKDKSVFYKSSGYLKDLLGEGN